ncbi:Myb-related protein A [Trichinella spiralis]|uniref:Myb-related protein A n=1 Tax=Trichinella spiralis TaxID=6334 RepID=UPI0001EFC9C1|nr:Myb-related protein A [Trichinella spiralis]
MNSSDLSQYAATLACLKKPPRLSVSELDSGYLSPIEVRNKVGPMECLVETPANSFWHSDRCVMEEAKVGRYLFTDRKISPLKYDDDSTKVNSSPDYPDFSTPNTSGQNRRPNMQTPSFQEVLNRADKLKMDTAVHLQINKRTIFPKDLSRLLIPVGSPETAHLSYSKVRNVSQKNTVLKPLTSTPRPGSKNAFDDFGDDSMKDDLNPDLLPRQNNSLDENDDNDFFPLFSFTTPTKQRYVAPLSPRTPTPFKKAMRDLERREGALNSSSLLSSPPSAEDIREVIKKDEADTLQKHRMKSVRRLLMRSIEGASANTSAVLHSSVQKLPRIKEETNNGLKNVVLPAKKVLKIVLEAPPLKLPLPVPNSHEMDERWRLVAYGKTSASVDMYKKAKKLLPENSDDSND